VNTESGGEHFARTVIEETSRPSPQRGMYDGDNKPSISELQAEQKGWGLSIGGTSKGKKKLRGGSEWEKALAGFSMIQRNA